MAEKDKSSALLPGWVSGPAYQGPIAQGPWLVFDSLFMA